MPVFLFLFRDCDNTLINVCYEIENLVSLRDPINCHDSIVIINGYNNKKLCYTCDTSNVANKPAFLWSHKLFIAWFALFFKFLLYDSHIISKLLFENVAEARYCSYHSYPIRIQVRSSVPNPVRKIRWSRLI